MLNRKNLDALNALNRQIDQLSALPLKNLPKYSDNLTSPTNNSLPTNTSNNNPNNNINNPNNNINNNSFIMHLDAYSVQNNTQDTEMLFMRAEQDSPPPTLILENPSFLQDKMMNSSFINFDSIQNETLRLGDFHELKDDISPHPAGTNRQNVNAPSANMNNSPLNHYDVPYFSDHNSSFDNLNSIAGNNTVNNTKQRLNQPQKQNNDTAFTLQNHLEFSNYFENALFNHATTHAENGSQSPFLNLGNSNNSYSKFPEVSSKKSKSNDGPHHKHLPSTSSNSDENSRAVVNALRTLQERVAKLENEKNAAKDKISVLEQELSTTRKLLFYHQQQQDGNQQQFDLNNVQTAYKSRSPSPIKSSANECDTTMDRISKAREQVCMLQKRVEEAHENLETSKSRSVSPNQFGASLNSKPPFANNQSSLDKNAQNTNPVSTLGPNTNDNPNVNNEFAESNKNFADHISQKIQKEIERERELRKTLENLMSPNSKGKQSSQRATTDYKKSGKKKPVSKKAENDLNERGPKWEKVESKPKHSTKMKPNASVPNVLETIQDPSAIGREMPFVVGKNTGKSFSVTANLQKVFSMLKHHNDEDCETCHQSNASSKHHHHDKKDQPKPLKKKVSANKDYELQQQEQLVFPTAESTSLLEVLGVLEDEFRNLKVQYHELVEDYERTAEEMTQRTISEKDGSKALKQTGDMLRVVIQNMETKGDQISILRDIVATSMTQMRPKTVKKTKPKSYELNTTSSRMKLNSKSSLDGSVGGSGTIETTKTMGKSTSSGLGRAQASLSLLKSTFKVQDALNVPSIQ